MDCFRHRQHDADVVCLQKVDAGLIELENVADRHVQRQQQKREQLVDDDHEQRGRVQDSVPAVAEHSLGKCKRRH
ncbi:hypothetical protein KL905_004557 [Ogataea polymorpha]|nr:hypothetical protein KL936_004477 [Ogataea polymorpha]KAG7896488.1 hypothetical protein KL908_001002 [Ogataea polymorpha]KAG7901038.1 hypothetical protein KL907_004483 [Ogataea polymorpha]KAG7906406.1 hypothetical protein KL906_004498 [Ogataea polymorpha]KAG7916827.1 hypothetical protein KL905_004557 [Ogataea polymorpha]